MTRQSARTRLRTTASRPALLALTLLLAGAAESVAGQLYVSTGGSDANACTQAAPCRQIRRAVSRAVPGDTIFVADGTYLGFTIDGFAGTASAPLTILSATRGAEVLPTTDRGDNEANIHVYGSSYVVIDGLRSFDAPNFGVRISTSQHVTVRNGVFGRNGLHGIFTGHADDVLIEGNECYGQLASHGIYVSNSGDRPIVRRNLSHDNVKAGIQLNADLSSGGDGIISGALIEANILYNNSGDSSAINLDGVQDSIVRNNLIFNNHETAITFFQIDGAAGPKGNQVLHNTIDVPADGRSGLVIRDSVGPNTVRNNILYNRSSGTGLKFGNSTDLSNTDSDYNVVDRLTADDGNTVLTLAQWKAQGREPHSLSATPAALWVDAASTNYHLASSSPAIDAGTTLVSVTTDIDGHTRPAGASSDIGAYEASGTLSSSQLSVADVRVTEGNSGTTNAVFVVTLSPAATSTVTANWSTANGTATSGSDYTAASGTLSFAAGETTKNVTVAVTGDTVVEGDETFYVTLTNPGNATISRAQATGTILNDDVAAVTVSLNDVSVSEGNSGTTNAVLTLTLSAASTQAVSVDYSTANGTATAPADYTALAGSVSFAAGQTSRTITIAVVGDTTIEPNETLVVNLSNAVGATISKAQGQVTITNDDLPALTINDVTVTEGNSGTTAATFTVTLSSAASSTVTVSYATANGTAAAGSDYVAKSGTLTFAAGVTSQTIAVTVNGDTTVEPNEAFVVNLTAPSGATLADGQGVGTITNDDAAALSINDVSLAEGNAGTTNATFTVTLSPAAASTVTVNYATADATATAGSDYVAKTGTLTFAAGVTSQTIAVTVNGDTTVEPNETFLVNLSGASGATIADGQGVATITNDDTAPPPAGAEQVVWTNLVGVTADSSGLLKTLTNGWNAGASSTRAIASGNGYVELTVADTSSIYMFGLSNGDTDQGYADIDFALYYSGTANALRIYEKGLYQGAYGPVAVGDKLRVAVESGVVRYYRNGVVVYKSGLAPAYPLLVDTSVASTGSRVPAVTLAGTLTTVGAGAPVQATESVSWASLVGVTADSSGLLKTLTNGWNAGASSTKAIASGDGYVELTVADTTSIYMFGLSNGDTDQGYADIDFALYYSGTANALRIYEKGLYQGAYGAVSVGDKLRVAVEGGVLRYYRNGALVYQSGFAPVYPLLVDTSLASTGSRLPTPTLSGLLMQLGGAAPPPPLPTEQAAWTNAVGVTADSSGLLKTTATGWNAGASSTRSIASGDGYAELTVADTTSVYMFGLSNGDTDQTYADIDFALYYSGTANALRIYEKGVYQGAFGAVALGDKLRVALEGGVVRCRRNGTLVYQSAAVPAYPLLVDTSIATTGSRVPTVTLAGTLK